MQNKSCLITPFHILKHFGLALFALTLIIFPNQCRAETIKNIKRLGSFEICASPRAMPLSDLKAELDKKQPGIQIELGEKLAKALNVSLKTSWISYSYHAKYTKCDAFLGVARIKDEPENIYLKKTIPYFKVEMIFVSSKPITLTKPSDFKGLKVAVPNGSLVHDAILKTGAEIFVGFRTDDDKLAAVQKGEVDLALVTNLGLGWYEKQNPEFKSFQISSKIVSKNYEYDMAIGLRKADKMTVRDFNDIINQLIDDGSMKSIFESYGVKYQVNRWEGEFIR